MSGRIDHNYSIGASGKSRRTVYLPKEFRGKGVFRECCTALNSSFPRDIQLMAVVRPFTLADESKAKDFSFEGMRFLDDQEQASRISNCLKKYGGFESADPMNYFSLVELIDKMEKGIPICKGELLVRCL